MMARIVLILCIAGGCTKSGEKNNSISLSVTAVEPQAYILPSDVTLKLSFSQPVARESITTKTITLVAEKAFDDRAKKTHYSQRNGRVPQERVELDFTIVDEITISLKPQQPLKSNTKYLLMLSSKISSQQGGNLTAPNGESKEFSYPFVTENTGLMLTGHDIISDQTPLVELNRRVFRLTFDDVFDLKTDTIYIKSLAPVPTIEFISQNIEQKEITITIQGPAQGCEVWRKDSDYSFVVQPGPINGNPQAPLEVSFHTGAACDDVKLTGWARSWATASDTSALVQLSTSRPGSLYLWYGRKDGPLDCLGKKCPLVIEGSGVKQQNTQTPIFLHSVESSGLIIDQAYNYQMVIEDDRLGRHYDEGEFVTQPVPKIAISEVMLNPALPSGASESTGEFIELFNSASQEYSLNGYRLSIGRDDSNDTSVCALPRGITIRPGQYLIIGGNAFNSLLYGDISPLQLIKMPTKTICGQFSNSAASYFELKDDRGRLISSFKPHLIADQEGQSIERFFSNVIEIDSTTFCWSRSDVGPSPGRLNSVMIKGCEK